jgi:CRP/FNR family transcriptional regulator
MDKNLDRTALFRALTGSDREALLAETRVLNAVRGNLLVQQGAAIPGAFLVLDGTLRVYGMNAQGKEATLYRVHSGGLCLLSLNATFSGTRFPAWVNVESKSARVAVLPGSRTRQIFERAPALRELVLNSLTATIGELLVQLDEAMLTPLSERIFNLLLRHADARRNVAITHQQLADHLGVTREAVSRELAVLVRRKILRTGRKTITLAVDKPSQF